MTIRFWMCLCLMFALSSRSQLYRDTIIRICFQQTLWPGDVPLWGHCHSRDPYDLPSAVAYQLCCFGWKCLFSTIIDEMQRKRFKDCANLQVEHLVWEPRFELRSCGILGRIFIQYTAQCDGNYELPRSITRNFLYLLANQTSSNWLIMKLDHLDATLYPQLLIKMTRAPEGRHNGVLPSCFSAQ